MTEGVRSVPPRVVRSFSLVLVAGAGIRLLAAVIAGFVEWHDSAGSSFAVSGRARAFDVLTTFGQAGDGTGVLLALTGAATACWLSWRDDPIAMTLRAVVAWLFGATAALALANGLGVGLVYSIDPSHQTSRLIATEGFALAYMVVAVGSIILLRQLSLVFDEQDSGGLDAFVFAVDRKSGDVRAYLSAGDAMRRTHIYSVEDDEFVFYTDEGVLLDASIVDERIVLRPTDQERPGQLLTALKEFANRRGIAVDEDDVDDPTAYAVPISRWHWLEMWPPWMRPIGMLFRRTG